MAAGEGKANVIRAGIEDPAEKARPSSVLHGMPNARFYVTHGAAMKLTKRKQEKVQFIPEGTLKFAIAHLAGNSKASITPYLVQPTSDYILLESCIYDASLHLKIPVHKLTIDDVVNKSELVQLPSWLTQNPLAFQVLCACASRRLKEKIEGGLSESSPTGIRVLHTAPHHDDIMLSYHGAMHDMLGRQPVSGTYGPHHLPIEPLHSHNPHVPAFPTHHAPNHSNNRSRAGSFTSYADNRLGESFNGNLNHFAYLTSGFHSVNDDFLWNKVRGVLGKWYNKEGSSFLVEAVTTGQLTREYDDIMSEFRNAFFLKNDEVQDHIENLIFLRKIAEVWQISVTMSYGQLVEELRSKVEWVRDSYLSNHQPGDAVPKEMQLLKGCMRESEVDRVWALSRMPMNRIHHLRSK